MPPILVLDDDPDVVKLVGDVLEEAGYRVNATTDPREALRLAEEKPPRLVLVDLMMPHLDGEAFLDALRRKLGDRMPKVVLVTASLTRDEVATRTGAAASLPKPFDVQDIRDVVHRFCGGP